MGSTRFTALALGALLAAALAGAPAAAQSKCTSAKHKALGKFLQSREGCLAKGAKAGTAVDPLCVAKAESKLQSAFIKAEQKADCLSNGDEDLIESLAVDFVLDMQQLLEPQPGVCCTQGIGCGWSVDAATCTGAGGTAGAAGSVCSGTGSCVAPPAVPGPCCEGVSFGGGTSCAAGPFDSTLCEMGGGTFFVDSICHQSRDCIELP
jgi:hypothetical protein